MNAASVSLYLDLESNRKADLEVIARASLAFAAAIKDAAYVLDPSLEIRVELVSGTEGSLSLNSLIRSVKSNVPINKKMVRTLALMALVWFGDHVGGTVYDRVVNYLTENEETSHLSKKDKEELAAMVTDAIEKQLARPHVENVYGALEADPAVKGVGATSKPGERPKYIVPRSEFRPRSGTAVALQQDIKKRIRTSRETVRLISPVLKAGTRKWKFSGKEGEFGAHIKDTTAIQDILEGRRVVPMVDGIEMEVELATSEEKTENVWVIQDRNVLKIYRVVTPMRQRALPLPRPTTPPEKPKPKGNKKRKK